MKKSRIAGMVTAVLMLAAIPAIANAQPRISVRLEFGIPPVNGYYASLSESYGVPYQDVCVMHDAGVVDEDIPVILYIYTHSQYSLRQIYSLRLRGATWDNLSNWCGVPLYGYRSGPPYGNAYGYYRHGPGKRGYEAGRWDNEGNRNHGRGWKGERGRDRSDEDR